MSLITLNAGSSSLKFAVFDDQGEDRRLKGHVDGVGEAMRLTLERPGGGRETFTPADADTHEGALSAAMDIIGREAGEAVSAVGHRIVHGGPDFAAPVVLDPSIETRLAQLGAMAPLHQPHNLAGVRAARAAFPHARQVACFDTGFHRTHPWVNDAFALPRRFYEDGVRRYGFHGLSYTYLNDRLAELAPGGRPERVAVAHLGAGASMCAIKHGRSVGSTMGFSALDGLPMATRCGQLDPGVVLHLMTSYGLDAAALSELLYTESGLKGLSGLSGDMRVLQKSDAREAAQAIDYFVFRCRRELAAMTAILEGLDAVVFAGGVGENAPVIRERICEGFDFLGINLDPAANGEAIGAERRISAADAPVAVWVIPTDEEAVIARETAALTA